MLCAFVMRSHSVMSAFMFVLAFHLVRRTVLLHDFVDVHVGHILLAAFGFTALRFSSFGGKSSVRAGISPHLALIGWLSVLWREYDGHCGCSS